jgi:multiple antibiotic resistance protein
LLIWNAFLIAFTALLPLVNPIGSALLFLGVVGPAKPEVYRSLARRVALNNIIFLTIIELLGAAILRFFGISLPIVQFSGGIVIAAIGWSMLNAQDNPEHSEAQQEDATLEADTNTRALDQKAFYPLTFPITSGPGTLVVMLTLTAHISDRAVARNVLGHVGILIAIVLLSALVYLCYANAPRITKAVAPSTVHGILRVVAFILLCIGVQIAWNGLASLLTSVVHPVVQP